MGLNPYIDKLNPLQLKRSTLVPLLKLSNCLLRSLYSPPSLVFGSGFLVEELGVGSCDRRFHCYLIVVIDDWITTSCFVLTVDPMNRNL